MIFEKKAIVLLITLAASRAQILNAQQKNQSPDPLVPTIGDVMRDQLFKLGNTLDQERQLRAQLASNIAALKKQVADCGTCADRPKIQSNLNEALAADDAVTSVEGSALHMLGLPGKDLPEFERMFVESLIHPKMYDAYGARLNQVKGTVFQSCREQFSFDVVILGLPQSKKEELGIIGNLDKYHALQKQQNELMQRCEQENDSVVLMAHQKAAATLCYAFHDTAAAWVWARQVRSGYTENERAKVWAAYDACMNENDIATAMCSKEMRVQVQHQRDLSPGRVIPDPPPCRGPDVLAEEKANAHGMLIAHTVELSEAQALKLVTYKVEPKFFPAVARGTEVVAQILVDVTGRVLTVENPGKFGNFELDVGVPVQQWRFQPYLKDGKPQYFHATLVFYSP